MKEEYDVIVVGGGATGLGVARDCSLRGMRVALVEKGDWANGASGRNHGLLHSGARYAVTDRESAEECIRENAVLRRVARHCVDPTDGLFITLPEDDLGYQADFIAACRAAGIPAERLDPREAERLEPAVPRGIAGAVRVPDGAIDPFRLTLANAVDAERHGAVLYRYHEVVQLLQRSGRIEGVEIAPWGPGERKRLYAPLTINASGIWGSILLQKVGVELCMFAAKGALLVFEHRVNRMVINRCRKPADADILVPGDTACILGTTSTRVPLETVDNLRVTDEEVDLLLKEGGQMVPSLQEVRIMRAYAGVRPLVAAAGDSTGRALSRGIVLIDHAQRDGLGGMCTITGGKLITYRLMAEQAADLASKKLGIGGPCETAVRPLPGSERVEQMADVRTDAQRKFHFSMRRRQVQDRLGTLAEGVSLATAVDRALVCECEEVTVGEVKNAFRELHTQTLDDLRRRTRMGMGSCQGMLCSCRAAELARRHAGGDKRSVEDMKMWLEARWRGVRPVAWGEGLREAELVQWLYREVIGLQRAESDAV